MSSDRCPSIDPHDSLQCGRRVHEDDQCQFGGIGWRKGGAQSDRLFSLPGDAYATTSDDCYTPRWVFDAMELTFDLDVAAPPEGPRHVPAARWYTAADDGLTQPWDGTVWCNPPYSKFRPWAERWAKHPRGVLMGMTSARSMGRALALRYADAVAVIDVQFERPDLPLRDVPTAIFVAFRGVGVEPARRLALFDDRGSVLYGEPSMLSAWQSGYDEADTFHEDWRRADTPPVNPFGGVA